MDFFYIPSEEKNVMVFVVICDFIYAYSWESNLTSKKCTVGTNE